MKLKEIPRTATFAWSPGQHLPIIATGTVAGALDASFSNTTELELFNLNLKSDSGVELQSAGVVNSNARFDRLVWGIANDKTYGIVAGGLENGEISLYDPAIILEGGDSEKALILRNNAHSGNVRGLQFNPFQINLLASAATNAEIFIWDLTKPDKPYTPGARSPKLENITHLAWNNQVQHILATSSNTGSTVIWDLRSKKHVMDLSFVGSTVTGGYSMGNMNMAPGMSTGVRRGTTAVAWSPDNATQIITASEDDINPVIVMWDVRNAHAPEKILTGHQKGILSLSWCQRDADLLLSCGKDNRVLCWNPRTAEIIGELPASSNWVFDVQWCPGNPDLFASASFDGKVNVHSLQSGQNENDQKIASAYEPSLTLKQPPKWLKRPVGVALGFGGKLVSFDNKRHIVKVSTIITEPEIVQRSTELESLVESKLLDSFCESRGKSASNDFESENWKVLHTMFNENENAREQLVKHLGFSKDDVVTQITIATKNMSINGSVNTEKTQVETDNEQNVIKRKSVAEAAGVPLPTSPIDVKSEKKDYGVVDNSAVKSENVDELFSGSSTSGGPSDASDFFSSEIIPDAFPIHSATSTYNEPTSSSINKGIFKIYPAQESDVDKLITRSIVLGDFESAVNLCLETDRLSDAVLLAGCGGPELLQKTRKIYFEKKASNVPYLRLLQSIVSEDLSDIVYNADLSEWQEVVVVLCTFARSEDFSGLCNALGQRLEQEYRKLYGSSNDRSKGMEYMKNAVFCYLAAGNLENVVNIWITEQEEEERAELERAELEHADQGDAKSSSFRYSLHAKFLQSLIEKVTVFRKAIDYVDPALVQNLDTNTTESNNQLFKLSKLYDKYAEYAEILAYQGRLTTAIKYLNLTPLEYKKTDANNIDQLAVIKERLYHSGVDIGSIKAPAFPFEHVYVGAEGEINPSLAPIMGNIDGTTYQPQINPNLYNNQQVAQPPYYNQYAYNQPVAANAPFQPMSPIQQQIQQQSIQPILQQPHYNNFPLYNAPIQNQPYNPGYQPAFPAYNQPQYQDNANFIPPPQIANTNIQNVNPPQQQAEVPAAYKKNIPNWNDPPVVSSAKKVAQAQVNKLQPITSPFPSTSPALQGTVPPPGVQGIFPPNQNIQGIVPPPGGIFPPNQNIQGTIANLPPPANRAIAAATGYQPNSPMSPQSAGNYYPPPPPPPKMGAPSQLHAQQIQNPQSPQSHYGPGRSAPTPPPQANAGYQAAAYGGQNTTHTGSNLVYGAPTPQPPIQQQVPTQNQQPVAQPARTPTPVKTPTPVNKHPVGDRNHIPTSQKPIYDVLSKELQRAKHYHTSGPWGKQLLDTEKRLNTLFDALNNEEISEPIIDSLLKLVQAMEIRDYTTANNLQVNLLTSYSNETKWLIGIKQLINIMKNTP
ncbi:WD40 repeat-like protein [Rhizophagus irregularis]|nr:WD40 repeat-like protein [Rhizophagus irregularis]